MHKQPKSVAEQSKILSFFASPKGRKITFFTAITASLGSFALKFFPETFLTKKHREFVALYKDGAERQLSEALQKRYAIAEEIVQLNDFRRKYADPFMVTSFDTYHIGSFNYQYGAYTGIPVNYTYTSKSDINKSDIIIRGNPVDWNSQGGKLLEEALVLKEDEQIFGITRELIQLKDDNLLLKSLYAPVSIFTYYTATSYINSKMFLFYKPLMFRFVGYTVIGLFIFGTYALATDYTQTANEAETDNKLASLGRNFIEAGIRFYDKLLKKNVAIRQLTGDDSQFTASGNENFLVRNCRLPLTIRKNFFELKLKELDEKEKTKVEEGGNPEK